MSVVNLKIFVDGIWVPTLRIPSDSFARFTLSPPRWLAYLGLIITGRPGRLLDLASMQDTDLDVPESIDLTLTHDYGYEFEGDLLPADPNFERHPLSPSSNGSLTNSFRMRLANRDDNKCVISGATGELESAHILRAGMSHEYIRRVTTLRPLNEEGIIDPIISDINDTRNGLIIHILPHKYLGNRAAILKVPNLFLKLEHMPAPQKSPNSQDLHPHHFWQLFEPASDPEMSAAYLPHNRRLRYPLDQEAQAQFPPHSVFALQYAAVALKYWKSEAYVDLFQERGGSKFYSALDTTDAGIRNPQSPEERDSQSDEKEDRWQQHAHNGDVDPMMLVLFFRDLVENECRFKTGDIRRQQEARDHESRKTIMDWRDKVGL